jgi:hypothetical protein
MHGTHESHVRTPLDARRLAFAAPNGPALLSVSKQVDTRTAGGRLVLNVLGAVSQWEREAIGERTSVAMQHMSERGEYVVACSRPHDEGGAEAMAGADEPLCLQASGRAGR